MPTPGQFSVDDQITALKTMRDNYLNALVADSLNPQMDYSFDGQSVDRTGWREKTKMLVQECNELIATLDLTEITTVQV